MTRSILGPHKTPLSNKTQDQLDLLRDRQATDRDIRYGEWQAVKCGLCGRQHRVDINGDFTCPRERKVQ